MDDRTIILTIGRDDTDIKLLDDTTAEISTAEPPYYKLIKYSEIKTKYMKRLKELMGGE